MCHRCGASQGSDCDESSSSSTGQFLILFSENPSVMLQLYLTTILILFIFVFVGWLITHFIRWRPIKSFLFSWCKTTRWRFGGLKGIYINDGCLEPILGVEMWIDQQRLNYLNVFSKWFYNLLVFGKVLLKKEELKKLLAKRAWKLKFPEASSKLVVLIHWVLNFMFNPLPMAI